MSDSSYTQILKSSSLIGGAQGINLLLSMVRVKFTAVLIGPVGVGLAGNYGAIQGVVGAVAGLGIQASGVREIAAAVGKEDSQAIGRAIVILRRMCWFTGLVGMLAMMALSPLLSQWTFSSSDHALEIALLGVTILLTNLSGGQTALIQGTRRIGDLARVNVIGATAGTVIAIGCYGALGVRGIVPALLLMAVVNLLASWHYARRVPVPKVVMSWWESFRAAGGLIRLGLVFMSTVLIGSLVAYLTVTLITQQLGLAAVGIFSAAFALSRMGVGFVVNAMGADYYPRLTAVASDRAAVNRLVNEQTEIGLLLAIPGLLATLSCAPWVIRLFYTEAFLPAADLLQWFVLGCLGEVVSWPLTFVMLALGKGQWFFITVTLFNVVYLALIVVGLITQGMEGVAMAFFIVYLGHTAVMYGVGYHLTGFYWSPACWRLFRVLLPIIAVVFSATRLLPLWLATLFGVVATLAAAVLCLRELVQRTGKEHRVVQAACRVPGMRWACGLPE